MTPESIPRRPMPAPCSTTCRRPVPQAGTPRPERGSYQSSRVWVFFDLLPISGKLREVIKWTKTTAMLDPGPNGDLASSGIFTAKRRTLGYRMVEQTVLPRQRSSEEPGSRARQRH